jgi:hypothetical protein
VRGRVPSVGLPISADERMYTDNYHVLTYQMMPYRRIRSDLLLTADFASCLVVDLPLSSKNKTVVVTSVDSIQLLALRPTSEQIASDYLLGEIHTI